MIQGGGIITALGTLGMMLWLYSIPHEQKNVPKRVGILCGLGFLTGIVLKLFNQNWLQVTDIADAADIAIAY